MGILHPALGEGTRMIKAILFACLATVAFAEAEADAKADPYLLYGGYGGYGHGLGYGGYGGYSGHGLGYGYGHGLGYYGKRSADAEPEAKADAAADPYYYGGYGLGYAGYGHGYGLG